MRMTGLGWLSTRCRGSLCTRYGGGMPHACRKDEAVHCRQLQHTGLAMLLQVLH